MSKDGIVMAIAHNQYDIRGVQFHPESYMTEYGHRIIHNWINHLICAEELFQLMKQYYFFVLRVKFSVYFFELF